MKKITTHKEWFATKKIENITDVIDELLEDEEVTDVKVEKTGDGFIVSWKE